MILHQAAAHRARFLTALISSIFLLAVSANGETPARAITQRRKPVRSAAAKPQPQATSPEEAAATGLITYALRLRPGQDLRVELEKFTKAKRLRAGFILTTVGSLQKASLRMANQSNATLFEDKFEIVSLVGTLSPDGPHLHLSISDGTGKTIGGHLVEGCIIYTTAEIVIGELKGVRFTREKDAQTGYQELRIRRP